MTRIMDFDYTSVARQTGYAELAQEDTMNDTHEAPTRRITLAAITLIGLTTGQPTRAERLHAIAAAQDRITKTTDNSEIEKDAAIIVANLSGLLS